MNRSSVCDVEQELWSGSLVLSVPLDIVDITVIFTGQAEASSLCNMILSTFWLYAVHEPRGCKMSIIHVSLSVRDSNIKRLDTGSGLFL